MQNISLKEKGMVLYAYLTLSGLSIDETAEHFLDEYDETSDQRVVRILKDYGFNEKNSGRFARLYSFAFKRGVYSEMDINLFKQQDVAAFVQANPEGGTPEEMERFLRARINERLHQQRSGKPISQISQPEQQAPEQTEKLPEPTLPLQPNESVENAPGPVKNTLNIEDDIQDNTEAPEKAFADIADKSDKADKAAKKPKKANASGKKWGKIVGAVIGAALLGLMFYSSCGGSSGSCASVTCVSSKTMNAEINVGYTSKTDYDNVCMVVDGKFRSYLENRTINKFTAGIGSGKHTIFVEYFKDGTRYTTDTVEFRVNKNGDVINFLLAPVGEKLVLVLSNI